MEPEVEITRQRSSL